MANYKKAIGYYDIVIEEQKSYSSIEVGNAYLRRGVCLDNLNNPSLALSSYFTALSFFEKLQNKNRIGVTYKNIGVLYKKTKDYEISNKYLHQSLTLLESIADSTLIPMVINDIANNLYSEKKYESSLQLRLQYFNRYQSTMDDYLLGAFYNNIGNCYRKLQKDSALFFYTKALEIATVAKDNALQFDVFSNMGEIYRERKDYTKAIANYNQALQLKASDNDTLALAITFENLALCYAETNNSNSAYTYLKKATELNESLFNSEKAKITTELSEKYESDKKDVQIKTQQLENRLKTRNITLSLIGLGLVSLLAGVAYYNFRKKKKTNEILEQQKNEILVLNNALDKSNQTKTQLFSVISHDLRAPVSSLYTYLQLQQLQEQKEGMKQVSQQTEQLLETLEDILVWSKTQLHQFVPTIETISLHTITTQILLLVQNEIESKQLIIANNIAENEFLKTDVNMLGVLLRNLLFNAVRYAKMNSVITLSTQHTIENCTLSIENETQEPAQEILNKLNSSAVDSSKKGLGNTLINDFAHKLNAKIVYTATEKTVKTALIFPL